LKERERKTTKKRKRKTERKKNKDDVRIFFFPLTRFIGDRVPIDLGDSSDDVLGLRSVGTECKKVSVAQRRWGVSEFVLIGSSAPHGFESGRLG
jgi:hypothetical protein